MLSAREYAKMKGVKFVGKLNHTKVMVWIKSKKCGPMKLAISFTQGLVIQRLF